MLSCGLAATAVKAASPLNGSGGRNHISNSSSYFVQPPQRHSSHFARLLPFLLGEGVCRLSFLDY